MLTLSLRAICRAPPIKSTPAMMMSTSHGRLSHYNSQLVVWLLPRELGLFAALSDSIFFARTSITSPTALTTAPCGWGRAATVKEGHYA